MVLGRTVGIIPVSRWPCFSAVVCFVYADIDFLKSKRCPVGDSLFWKNQDGLQVLVDGKDMQIHEHRYKCWWMVITIWTHVVCTYCNIAF